MTFGFVGRQQDLGRGGVDGDDGRYDDKLLSIGVGNGGGNNKKYTEYRDIRTWVRKEI